MYVSKRKFKFSIKLKFLHSRLLKIGIEPPNYVSFRYRVKCRADNKIFRFFDVGLQAKRPRDQQHQALLGPLHTWYGSKWVIPLLRMTFSIFLIKKSVLVGRNSSEHLRLVKSIRMPIVHRERTRAHLFQCESSNFYLDWWTLRG